MRRGLLAFTLVVLGMLWPGATAIGAGPTVNTSGGDSDPRFVPDQVTIAVGDSVTWNNADLGNHNVVAVNGSFKGGGNPLTHDPAPGPWTFTHQFNQPGTFKYYCSQHSDHGNGGMVGFVIVRPNDTTPPKITNLSAKPGTLCNKKTKKCKHPGTHVKFTLSEPAGVQGDVKRSGSKKPFKSAFQVQGHKGKNDVKWGAKGLSPGNYTLRLRAYDAAGNRSKFATVQVTVKHS